MTVVIVNNGGANMNSLVFALERLQQKPVVTDDVDRISTADRVILPGVGHAASSMQKMSQDNIIETLQSLSTPVLGICLGMQLLFDSSDEGPTPCLGIIDGDIAQLKKTAEYPCPHMGWNRLNIEQQHPLLEGIPNGSHMYFVHSYYVPINQWSIATTHYGDSFCAIASRNNYSGVQFHPERSGEVGERLLANFLDFS